MVSPTTGKLTTARGLWWASQVVGDTTMTSILVSIPITEVVASTPGLLSYKRICFNPNTSTPMCRWPLLLLAVVKSDMTSIFSKTAWVVKLRFRRSLFTQSSSSYFLRHFRILHTKRMFDISSMTEVTIVNVELLWLSPCSTKIYGERHTKRRLHNIGTHKKTWQETRCYTLFGFIAFSKSTPILHCK